MRTAHDVWRENERYEDLSEFDKFIVDEYEADRAQERADEWEDQYGEALEDE